MFGIFGLKTSEIAFDYGLEMNLIGPQPLNEVTFIFSWCEVSPSDNKEMQNKNTN